MTGPKINFGCWVLAALLSWGAAGAWAQESAPPPNEPSSAPENAPPQPAPRPKQATPQERQMLGLPPMFLERLRNMTPEQQEQFLANNERFQSFPPARQAQIRRQLQIWNSLPAAQRQAIQQRLQVLEQLTPAQQAYVRNTLAPQWQHMRQDRKQAILKRLRDLRGLDDAQRTARLNDPYFLNGLDRAERQMLRDLANLRVALPGVPPAEPAKPTE